MSDVFLFSRGSGGTFFEGRRVSLEGASSDTIETSNTNNSGYQKTKLKKQDSFIIEQKQIIDAIKNFKNNPDNPRALQKISQFAKSKLDAVLNSNEFNGNKDEIDGILKVAEENKKIGIDQLYQRCKNNPSLNFPPKELDIIAVISLEDIVNAFGGSDRVRSNFFTILERTKLDQNSFDGLGESLKYNLEHSFLNTKEKKILFNKYCVSYKKLNDSKDSIQAIRKNVFTEFEIENETIRKTYMLSWSDKIQDLFRLSFITDDGNNKDVIEDIDSTEKEQKMYDDVSKILGKEVADTAKDNMNRYEIDNEKQRERAFKEIIIRYRDLMLPSVINSGIEMMDEEVTRSKNLELFFIEYEDGITPELKQRKKNIILKQHNFTKRFVGILKESEKTQSKLPLLRFIINGYEDPVYGTLLEETSFLSRKEANQMLAIEQEYKAMQSNFSSNASTYHSRTKALYKCLESDEYRDSNPKEKQHQIEALGIRISQKGIKNILDNGYISPLDFEDFLIYQRKWNFSDKQFVNAIYSPIRFPLEENNIHKILGLRTEEKVPHNIVAFYEYGSIEKISANMCTTFTQSEMTTKNSAEENSNRTENVIRSYNVIGNVQELNTIREDNLAFINPLVKQYQSTIDKCEDPEVTQELEQEFESMKKIQSSYENPITETDIIGPKAKLSSNLAELIDQDGKEAEKSIHEGIQEMIHRLKNESHVLLHPIAQALKETDPQERAKKLLLASRLGGKKLFEDIKEPTLYEQGHTNKLAIFNHWSKGELMTPDGIDAVKNMTTKGNKHNQKMIQSISQLEGNGYVIDEKNLNTVGGFRVYHVPEVDVIALPAELYERIKGINTSNVSSDLYPLLFFLSHEITHSMILENPEMLSNFEKRLEIADQEKNGNTNIYQEIKNGVNHAFSKNNGLASPMEELLSDVGAMLQYDENKREDIYANPTLYGIQNTGQHIKKVFTLLGENTLKHLFSDAFSKNKAFKKTVGVNTKDAGQAANDDNYNQLLQQAANDDSYDQEGVPEKTEEKIDNTPLTLARRKEYTDYLKDREKEMYDNIKQLEDGRSELPFDERQNMDSFIEKAKNGMNDAKTQMEHGVDTENQAGKVKEYVDDEISTKIGNATKQMGFVSGEEPGYLSNLWSGTTLMSLGDVGKIFSTTWEYIKRRHERNQKKRVGTVGNNLFKKWIPQLAGEFDKEKESAESAEISEIQEALKNKSDQGVIDFLPTVGNIDSFKATLKEMAGRGIIDWKDWRRPNEQKGKNGIGDVIRRKLRQFGCGVRFYKSDYNVEGDEVLLNSKYQRAFMKVYGDENMYWDLYNENVKKIDSEVTAGSEVANQRGGIPDQLNEWLRKGANGEPIPTHEYEGYVSFMVGDGTCDPWDFLYYLLMGVAEDVIPKAAIYRFWGKHSNDFPAIDGLHRYSKDDLMKVRDQIVPVGRGVWEGIPKTFLPWVHANIMTNPGTVQRATINLAQKNMPYDHDCAHLLAAVGDANTAVQFLASESTGSARFKPSTYNQALVGMMTNVASIGLYEDANALDFDKVQETIRRQAGFFAAYDLVGNRRIRGDGKARHSFSKSFLDETPRAGSSYNGDMNTNEYLKMGRAIFSSVADSEFKDICENLIFNPDLSPAEVKQRWDNNYSNLSVMQSVFPNGVKKIQEKDFEFQFADIVDSIFSYYFGSSPRAAENVKSVANAAASVANGKGISGVNGSADWGFKFLEKDTKQSGDNSGLLPPSYRELKLGNSLRSPKQSANEEKYNAQKTA